jgi:putative copper export protein
MEQFVNNLGVVTEILLYIDFSILMGGLLLSLVPETKRPPVHISKRILLVSVLLIPILSFIPLLEVVVLLSRDMGFGTTMSTILFTFEVGKAWLFTTVVSIFLFIRLSLININKNKAAIGTAIFLTVFLTFSAGYASHASSITDWIGFLSHSVHLLTVTVWAGVVLFIGWFSYNHKNWSSFFKWFSPLAVTSVVILIIAGYVTMKIDINSYENLNATLFQEYKDSLVINYGQALLIKHLFIIPLLVFAFINAILIRRKLQSNSQYNPIKWVKAESIFMILVMIATAFIGQDYPPHQVTQLVKTGGFSSLFELLNDQVINLPIHVVFDYSVTSYILFVFAVISAGCIILLSVKRESPALSFLFAIIFVICSYIGIVIGIRS